jgi:hypothetical protein
VGIFGSRSHREYENSYCGENSEMKKTILLAIVPVRRLIFHDRV